MCKSLQSLRALVSERLAAAAEEIFALVERTIAEYEEELCRSTEENQRKQQILEELLKTHGGKDVQAPPQRQALVSAPYKDDLLSSFIPDFTVKAEDDKDRTTLFQLPPTETTAEEEPDLKRFKSEPVDHIDLSSDSEGDSETPGGSSSQRRETEDHGDTAHTGPSESLGERYNHDIEANSPETHPNEGLSEDDAEKSRSHECLACGETFSHDGELREHMSSHVGAKPFSCPVCGKLFTRKNDYSLHLTVHTGDAPFKCPECEARFALRSHLQSHLKGHRAPPLCCPVCNKSFTRKYRLHSHMASHTGERPYSCPVCGRAFTRKDNLGTHMAMHNGKPFICTICNRCFVRKDRLTAHMASHTGKSFCKPGLNQD